MLSRDKKGAKDWLNKWKSNLIVLSESGYCVNYVYEFSSPDETSVKGGNLSQVAGQAVVVVKESLPQATLKKLHKTSVPPAPLVPRGRRSTAPLTVTSTPLIRKAIPVIFKAVMDAMQGASTAHQPMDDVDTVERPGKLDDLCCKIVSWFNTILRPCAGSRLINHLAT